MQEVIQDLFTLSRLEYEAGTLKSESVAVLEVMQEVVGEIRELARETQHALKLSGDPDLKIPGDASLLRCAFSNLVSNAVRHTPNRTKVEISWSRAGGLAELVVEDNGTGIPARHIPRLTERFYRVDAGRSRAAGGTGLGLAIVRQILDMHDARLSISSDEGRGARFCCQFPVSQVVGEHPGESLTQQAG